MVPLPVSILLAALLPPVDPEDQEPGQGQRQDVPDGQEQPKYNWPGSKQFFSCNIVNSLSILLILIQELYLYVL